MKTYDGKLKKKHYNIKLFLIGSSISTLIKFQGFSLFIIIIIFCMCSAFCNYGSLIRMKQWATWMFLLKYSQCNISSFLHHRPIFYNIYGKTLWSFFQSKNSAKKFNYHILYITEGYCDSVYRRKTGPTYAVWCNDIGLYMMNSFRSK